MILLEILLTIGVVVLFAELSDRFNKYIENKKKRKTKPWFEGEFMTGFHD
tara:strand:+ start:428 stop:577 length:150 start_codon:yes stop_codon:yes gene_type:complete